MMSKLRKMRLANKLCESRSRLMEENPFFALLLMYLKFVAVPQMDKISTNGRCIYFSADFVDKLYEYELDFILCHEIMHIICGHIFRPRDYEGDDYHFACDIQINALLFESCFEKGKYSHLGYLYSMIPGEKKLNPVDMTSLEIYSHLPYSLYILEDRSRSLHLADSDLMWQMTDDYDISGELILDIPQKENVLFNENISGDGEGKNLWRARASAAAKVVKSAACNKTGISNLPKFMERMAEMNGSRKIDWKKILNNFVQECVCDYSFSPPDRRFSDSIFFLPDFNESDFVTKDILFMVDTSGSVDDENLTCVYSEISGAIEQFGGKLKGKLGFFDAAVTPPLPFESVTDLLSIVPYGGGGTDFGVIFEYIRNNCRDDLPASIVIFTDGEGPYPDESATMGIPVLWIINNCYNSPPFGTITRVLAGEEQ